MRSAKEGLLYLQEEVEDMERELIELRLLYKDRKIPYRILDDRIKELCGYISEDIKISLHN